MLTTKQRIEKLQEAIALLQDADNLQQAALGDSDSSYATHNSIQTVIDDIAEDIEDLQRRAVGAV